MKSFIHDNYKFEKHYKQLKINGKNCYKWNIYIFINNSYQFVKYFHVSSKINKQQLLNFI
jgi:hypothetical protein